MDLSRLLYISERTAALDDKVLAEIVDRSRARNEALGISGLMLAGGESLIQVLEGNPLHVVTLFAKIRADPRHRDVRCLIDQNVDRRLFGEWGMRLGTPGQAGSLDRARLDPLLIRIRLSNDEQCEQGALMLLKEFQSQLIREAA